MTGGCPTCSATMAGLDAPPGISYWHCPRCGTLVRRTELWAEADVPALVERCRTFEAHVLLHPANNATDHPMAAKFQWTVIGIRESINRPEDRP